MHTFKFTISPWTVYLYSPGQNLYSTIWITLWSPLIERGQIYFRPLSYPLWQSPFIAYLSTANLDVSYLWTVNCHLAIILFYIISLLTSFPVRPLDRVTRLPFAICYLEMLCLTKHHFQSIWKRRNNSACIIIIESFHNNISWWFSTRVGVTTSLLKFPELFSEFWPILMILMFRQSSLVLSFSNLPVLLPIHWECTDRTNYNWYLRHHVS